MGTAIKWKKEYSVGVSVLDEHHQKLFKILSDLHAALSKKEGRVVIRDVLTVLLDYTQYHFTEEEKLMTKAACNGLIAHTEMHAAFAAELLEYKKKADAGMEEFITTTLMNRLNDWLINHIGRVDKLYAEAMYERGIR